MAEIKWIKITTNIFDDEKMKLIDAMPDADAIIVIWFKLLAQAGKINQEGALMMTQKLAYTDEMLATIFNRKIATIRLALETFEMLNMIERGAYIQITNWEKHQNIEGMEKIRLQNRTRQQEYRERQKRKALTNNVSVTLHNAIEEDIEEELDKEIDKELNKDKTILGQNTDIVYFENAELNKLFLEFLKLRKKLKAVNSDLAINKLLNVLKPYTDDVKIKMIENSIVSSWKSVYPLKEKPTMNERW